MTSSPVSIPSHSLTVAASKGPGSPGRAAERASWSEGFQSAFPLFVIGPACLVAGALLYISGTAAALSWGGSYDLPLWYLYLVLGAAGIVLGTIAVFSEVLPVAAEEPGRTPLNAPVANPSGAGASIPTRTTSPSPRNVAAPWDESVLPPKEDTSWASGAWTIDSPTNEVQAAEPSPSNVTPDPPRMHEQSRRKKPGPPRPS